MSEPHSEGGATPSSDDIERALDHMAASFIKQVRAPILHTPAEHGLDYEDVTFPSDDGVPLEGWLVPGDGERLIMANHPMGLSRSGIPAHLEPWRAIWGPAAMRSRSIWSRTSRSFTTGYDVLAYDLRNFGHSGSGNGGIASSGIFEARDVLGSLNYSRRRLDTRDMTIGLFSCSFGCSSTFHAMRARPGAFEGVRCLVGPQQVTMKIIVQACVAAQALPRGITVRVGGGT